MIASYGIVTGDDASVKDMRNMRYLVSLFLAFAIFFTSAHGTNSMEKVVIYTIPGCSGCHMAKSMLEDRDIPYKEIDVAGKPDVYREMIRKSGGRKTVPQIFIKGKHIGGYSDLDGATLDALKTEIDSSSSSETMEPLE